MPIVVSLIDTAKTVLIDAAPDMPPELWLLSAFVLGLLALTAIIDIFTTTVPDECIWLGLLAVTGLLGVYASWDIAAEHLQIAIAAGIVIWGVNQLWYRLFRHDALGMGDAKWTMLAVICFGVMPALFAWGVGAFLAVIFIGLMRLCRRKIARVTFAPFLFVGLCAGLYWLRLCA